MNECIKKPFLASLWTGKYTLHNEETHDISSTEQMAIYSTFEHQNHISEHYIGIMPITELAGSYLSCQNILEDLNKYSTYKK